MKHIPKHLIPALGLACWGVMISLGGGYNFTYYWLTAMGTAFVTGLLYRRAANRELAEQYQEKH